MPKITENLRNAQILADFSNLEIAQVDYFRNNFPDFAPPEWWDYSSEELKQMGNEKQWQLTQGLLHHCWEHQFKDIPSKASRIYDLVALLTSVFDPTGLFVTTIERMFKDVPCEGVRFEEGKVSLPDGVQFEFPKRRAFAHFSDMWGRIPLQQAIVFLFENSWRARFCAECKKRFVAVEPKSKFCGEKCSHNRRIQQERAWWNEHGPDWRRKRSKQKTRRRKK